MFPRTLLYTIILFGAVFVATLVCPSNGLSKQDPLKLLQTGKILVDRTHYLEAIDLFEEARDILDSEEKSETALYGDILYAIAEAKIKGRIHQGFSAYYVKSALAEIQRANKIREKTSGVLPQKLAQGYYLEGFIHKRFFRRKEEAMSCFVKTVNIDPSHAAAKRQLSDVITGER
jgi:tetratricopeptide (TPR) repeat protein